MPSRTILALVLAGGKGTRLHPLTTEHAKPALPFLSGLRLIDFALSNLVNSRISPIYVLAQYKPQSLIEHINTAWAAWSQGPGASIRMLLPRTGPAPGYFKGTADAVYQNLDLLEHHKPDLVAVFAADHVYRMDIRQMVDFHRERNAEVSVAAVPVPIARASSFGVMVTRADGSIDEFEEKPRHPSPIPTDPAYAYVSMGNYLFNPGTLVELLEQANECGGTDFGRDILPRLPGRHRVLAYDFARNRVPGVRAYEERGYWRDVGTLDALSAARQDVHGLWPRFELSNHKWPIHGEASELRAPVSNDTAFARVDRSSGYTGNSLVPCAIDQKDLPESEYFVRSTGPH